MTPTARPTVAVRWPKADADRFSLAEPLERDTGRAVDVLDGRHDLAVAGAPQRVTVPPEPTPNSHSPPMTQNASADDGRTERKTKQVDVHLDPETWRTIQRQAQAYARRPGKDAETAFWDAIHETVSTVPNPVVDGDVKGIEDVPRLEQIASGEEV